MDQFPQGNPRLQDLARHMQRIILPVRRRHIPHQTVGGVIWTPKQMNNPTASMCMDVYLHIIVFICINVIYRYTNGIHVLILSWKLTCEYRPNIAKKNIYIYIYFRVNCETYRNMKQLLNYCPKMICHAGLCWRLIIFHPSRISQNVSAIFGGFPCKHQQSNGNKTSGWQSITSMILIDS